MCGRFTQRLSWEELHRLADLIGQPRNLAPRYNIAPTTQIEVHRPAETGGNELVQMRWGLVPGWWKKPNSLQDETLHHSRLGLLRVDGQSGGENAALFFGAVQ